MLNETFPYRVLSSLVWNVPPSYNPQLLLVDMGSSVPTSKDSCNTRNVSCPIRLIVSHNLLGPVHIDLIAMAVITKNGYSTHCLHCLLLKNSIAFIFTFKIIPKQRSFSQMQTACFSNKLMGGGGWSEQV